MTSYQKDQPNILIISALLAITVELGLLSMSGIHFHLPLNDTRPTTEAIEAEVITLPEEQPKLIAASASSVPEETISKSNPTKVNPNAKTLTAPTSNQVEKGKPLSATHGPILIESPSPVIPEYLRSQDINSKVVIEFTVQSSGESSPRLLVSSGNDELDQIALSTARRWKFYPAESEHQAVAAKVKLRILFEVK